jgi:uncharacterized metal-binding protein
MKSLGIDIFSLAACPSRCVDEAMAKNGVLPGL